MFSYNAFKNLLDGFRGLFIDEGGENLVYLDPNNSETPVTVTKFNGTSTKALQDGNGKVIADTYATKAEITSKFGTSTVVDWDSIT